MKKNKPILWRARLFVVTAFVLLMSNLAFAQTTTFVNGIKFEYTPSSYIHDYSTNPTASYCGRQPNDWVNAIKFAGPAVKITFPVPVTRFSFLLGSVDVSNNETVAFSSINAPGATVTLSTDSGANCLIKDGNLLKPSTDGTNGKVIVSSTLPFTVINLDITGPYQVISVVGTTVSLCPSTAPLVNSAISNNCASATPTTVNLANAHTGTTPNTTSLVWYTSSTRILGSLVSNPSVVGNGNYYAFYYNATSDCYSPASSMVTVTIAPCCKAGTAQVPLTGSTISN